MHYPGINRTVSARTALRLLLRKSSQLSPFEKLHDVDDRHESWVYPASRRLATTYRCNQDAKPSSELQGFLIRRSLPLLCSINESQRTTAESNDKPHCRERARLVLVWLALAAQPRPALEFDGCRQTVHIRPWDRTSCAAPQDSIRENQ